MCTIWQVLFIYGSSNAIMAIVVTLPFKDFVGMIWCEVKKYKVHFMPFSSFVQQSTCNKLLPERKCHISNYIRYTLCGTPSLKHAIMFVYIQHVYIWRAHSSVHKNRTCFKLVGQKNVSVCQSIFLQRDDDLLKSLSAIKVDIEWKRKIFVCEYSE